MAIDPILFTLPQPQVPLIGPDGNVSRQWFYYFMGIFLRTGGNTPILPVDLKNQINALFVEEAFNDLQNPLVPVAFPVFLGETLPNDVPRASMNPIVAALMVSD